ncbi:hypothetical protein [Yersinia pseudotuberculosis]|uniref:hypothetical protein n=1 Tax=Yersinia pseudotuberculosis TaxID=633 RepID=UPI0005E28D28|nr:hypothetical protein [Yersinia pseudotuberculosis]CNC75773.1 tail collar domain-containing protein [Yersinia pseudotuberculosis]
MSRNDSFNKTWASAPAQFERPGDGLVARGWAGGASEDPPEAKWENWWHNRVDEALKELQNLGQLIWFADAPYQAGARVNHGSNRYIALEENTGVEPTGALDIGVWQKEDINLYLKTTNNLSEIAAAGPNAVLAAITNLNLLTTVNNANGALQVTRNLSDLNDTAAARTNLGLGGASSLSVGTTAGTVAAGNDSRIVGALQKSGGTIAGNLTVNGAISTSNLIDTIGISMKGGQTVVQGDGNIIGTGSAFGANGLVAALQDKIEGVRVTAISSQTGGTSPVGAFFVALNDSVQYFRYIQISKNGVWSTITT